MARKITKKGLERMLGSHELITLTRKKYPTEEIFGLLCYKDEYKEGSDESLVRVGGEFYIRCQARRTPPKPPYKDSIYGQYEVTISDGDIINRLHFWHRRVSSNVTIMRDYIIGYTVSF